jgi:hypothetical protein
MKLEHFELLLVITNGNAVVVTGEKFNDASSAIAVTAFGGQCEGTIRIHTIVVVFSSTSRNKLSTKQRNKKEQHIHVNRVKLRTEEHE